MRRRYRQDLFLEMIEGFESFCAAGRESFTVGQLQGCPNSQVGVIQDLRISACQAGPGAAAAEIFMRKGPERIALANLDGLGRARYGPLL